MARRPRPSRRLPAARPTARPAALPVALLTACALAVAGCSADDEDASSAAPVGTVIDSVVTVEGRTDAVMTPEGRIDLTIAPPAAELTGFDETYDRAAEGASLVGVGWTYDLASNPRTMNDTEVDPVVPRFTLVADGEEYSLDEVMLREDDELQTTGMPVELSGTLAVAVEGEPEDVAVRVDYDGVSQEVSYLEGRVETDGPEAALYGSPSDLASEDVACGGPTYEPTDLTIDPLVCEVTVARVPYRQGVGWAEPGTSWLTVRSRVQAGSLFWRQGTDDVSLYNLEEVTDEIRLGDLEPVDRTLPGESTVTPQTFTVFAVEGTGPGRSDLAPLQVVAVASSTGDYPSTPGAPTDPGVVVRWTVPLG